MVFNPFIWTADQLLMSISLNVGCFSSSWEILKRFGEGATTVGGTMYRRWIQILYYYFIFNHFLKESIKLKSQTKNFDADASVIDLEI